MKRIALTSFLIVAFAGQLAAQGGGGRGGRPAPAAVPATVTAPSALTTPDVPSAQYDSAYFAWVEGRYPDALAGFTRILNSPRAEQERERIATVTGEPFVTSDVSIDGSNVRWSRDGK